MKLFRRAPALAPVPTGLRMEDFALASRCLRTVEQRERARHRRAPATAELWEAYDKAFAEYLAQR